MKLFCIFALLMNSFVYFSNEFKITPESCGTSSNETVRKHASVGGIFKMGKKLTREQFIDRCNKIHLNKYDYSLSEFINVNSKIKIVCDKHGIFTQKAWYHLQGCGCKVCRSELMSLKLKSNTNDFINKSNKIHDNKYDYSLVNYLGNKIKIDIVCEKHGVFKQTPAEHLSGCGCSKCYDERRNLGVKLTTEIFIERGNILHKEKYDYSLVKYISANKKVKISCPLHGLFEQEANSHLMGHGCKLCANKFIGDKRFDSKEDFIKKSKLKHGDKYDYSLVEYKGAHVKIKIICDKHGVFSQKPTNHLSNQGCPKCNVYGSVSRNKLLKKLELEFKETTIIIEGKPDWLTSSKITNPQSLDIYFPDNNIAIEYQGDQHFIPINFFGGEKSHKYLKELDERKYNLCLNNGCKLYYFTYKPKHIPEKYLDNVYYKDIDLINEIKKHI